MRFKLRQMEIFRAVMIAGSVSGAARMLFVSQPAVSKLLAHTETSLGMRLFHRVSGKLVPTADAIRLFEEVKKVYDAAQKVDTFVDNLLSRPSGQINVSCSPSLGLSLVPRIVKTFLQRYPDVRLHLHTTLIQDAPQELLSGKSDLAITVLPLRGPNLQVEPLRQGRMVCAVPQGHKLAARCLLSLHDLAGERMILYSPGIPFGQLIRNAFDHYGCPLPAAVDVPRAELACSLVRRNVGLALVDEFSVADGVWNGLAVLPLKEDIPIEVSLIRSRFALSSPEVENFIRIMRCELGAG